ncbi:iron chelate uptake ABC transporter family permease subunit [Candidatus Poribacteria bacterium]|nr:iron chelate uptake ABC transporter family permease subunit [Candidatus Poribacteria bacterium]
MNAEIEIQLIASVVAAACALPGVFLVLRRMALMSDAISHAILVGIVLAFFVTKNIASPFLIIAAAFTGVITVVLVELLNRTRLVKEDAAIGLVFPVLFSIGVILIARYAGNVHLDTDAVLLGELAFAPFNRIVISGYDLGPQALYVMSAVLLVNILFIALFYKELKLATFDSGLAAALGFSPVFIHYTLMSLVSITTVGAFEAVGSILVVALMIAPPATAYLLTDSLMWMLGLSVSIGVISGISGYWLARFMDASIAGCMATMTGIFFILGLLFAPERGMVALARRHARNRWEFALWTLAVHLFNHENLPESATENRVDHLHEHVGWDREYAQKVLTHAKQRDIVEQENGRLYLTRTGRQMAKRALVK